MKSELKTMRYFIFILFLVSSFSCKTTQIRNNCNYEIDKSSKKKVYVFVDQQPEYPGDLKEMLLFFAKNLVYPQQDTFQGRFIIEIIVNKHGMVVDAMIHGKEKKDLTSAEKEIIRVAKTMPRWIAGKCRGKAVNVRLTIPLFL
jgi:protein TonB